MADWETHRVANPKPSGSAGSIPARGFKTMGNVAQAAEFRTVTPVVGGFESPRFPQIPCARGRVDRGTGLRSQRRGFESYRAYLNVRQEHGAPGGVLFWSLFYGKEVIAAEGEGARIEMVSRPP